MRTLIALSIGLVCLAASAEEKGALTFAPAKIAVPGLSLLDGAREAMPPMFGESSNVVLKDRRPSGRRQRLISRMPVVAPPDEVNYHLQVEAPNEATDYKLLMKDPEVDPAK